MKKGFFLKLGTFAQCLILFFFFSGWHVLTVSNGIGSHRGFLLSGGQKRQTLSGLVELTAPVNADRASKRILLRAAGLLDAAKKASGQDSLVQVWTIVELTKSRMASIVLRSSSASLSRQAHYDAILDCLSKVEKVRGLEPEMFKSVSQAKRFLERVYKSSPRDLLVSAMGWTKPLWSAAIGVGAIVMMTIGLILSYRMAEAAGQVSAAAKKTSEVVDALAPGANRVIGKLDKALTARADDSTKKGFFNRMTNAIFSVLAQRAANAPPRPVKK